MRLLFVRKRHQSLKTVLTIVIIFLGIQFRFVQTVEKKNVIATINETQPNKSSLVSINNQQGNDISLQDDTDRLFMETNSLPRTSKSEGGKSNTLIFTKEHRLNNDKVAKLNRRPKKMDRQNPKNDSQPDQLLHEYLNLLKRINVLNKWRLQKHSIHPNENKLHISLFDSRNYRQGFDKRRKWQYKQRVLLSTKLKRLQENHYFKYVKKLQSLLRKLIVNNISIRKRFNRLKRMILREMHTRIVEDAFLKETNKHIIRREFLKFIKTQFECKKVSDGKLHLVDQCLKCLCLPTFVDIMKYLRKIRRQILVTKLSFYVTNKWKHANRLNKIREIRRVKRGVRQMAKFNKRQAEKQNESHNNYGIGKGEKTPGMGREAWVSTNKLSKNDSSAMMSKLLRLMTRVRNLQDKKTHSHIPRTGQTNEIGTKTADSTNMEDSSDEDTSGLEVDVLDADDLREFADFDLNAPARREPTEADRQLLKNIERLTFLVLGPSKTRDPSIRKTIVPEKHGPRSPLPEKGYKEIPSLEKSKGKENSDADVATENENTHKMRDQYSESVGPESETKGFNTSRAEGINTKSYLKTKGKHSRNRKFKHVSKRIHHQRNNNVQHHIGKHKTFKRSIPDELPAQPGSSKAGSGINLVTVRAMNNTASAKVDVVTNRTVGSQNDHTSASEKNAQSSIEQSVKQTNDSSPNLHRRTRSVEALALIDGFRARWPGIRDALGSLQQRISELKSKYFQFSTDLSQLLETGDGYNEDARKVAERERKADKYMKEESAKLQLEKRRFDAFKKRIFKDEKKGEQLEKDALVGKAPRNGKAPGRGASNVKDEVEKGIQDEDQTREYDAPRKQTSVFTDHYEKPVPEMARLVNGAPFSDKYRVELENTIDAIDSRIENGEDHDLEKIHSALESMIWKSRMRSSHSKEKQVVNFPNTNENNIGTDKKMESPVDIIKSRVNELKTSDLLDAEKAKEMGISEQVNKKLKEPLSGIKVSDDTFLTRPRLNSRKRRKKRNVEIPSLIQFKSKKIIAKYYTNGPGRINENRVVHINKNKLLKQAGAQVKRNSIDHLKNYPRIELQRKRRNIVGKRNVAQRRRVEPLNTDKEPIEMRQRGSSSESSSNRRVRRTASGIQQTAVGFNEIDYGITRPPRVVSERAKRILAGVELEDDRDILTKEEFLQRNRVPTPEESSSDEVKTIVDDIYGGDILKDDGETDMDNYIKKYDTDYYISHGRENDIETEMDRAQARADLADDTEVGEAHIQEATSAALAEQEVDRLWDEIGPSVESSAALNDDRNRKDRVRRLFGKRVPNYPISGVKPMSDVSLVAVNDNPLSKISPALDTLTDIEADMIEPPDPGDDPIMVKVLGTDKKSVEKKKTELHRLMDSIPKMETLGEMSKVLKEANDDYKKGIGLENDVDKIYNVDDDVKPYDDITDESMANDPEEKFRLHYANGGTAFVDRYPVRKMVDEMGMSKSPERHMFRSMEAAEKRIEKSLTPVFLDKQEDEAVKTATKRLKYEKKREKLKHKKFVEEAQKRELQAINDLEKNNRVLINDKISQYKQMEKDLTEAAKEEDTFAKKRAENFKMAAKDLKAGKEIDAAALDR